MKVKNFKKFMVRGLVLGVVGLAVAASEIDPAVARKGLSASRYKALLKARKPKKAESPSPENGSEIALLDSKISSAFLEVADHYSEIRTKTVTENGSSHIGTCDSDYSPSINDVLDAFFHGTVGNEHAVIPGNVNVALDSVFSFRFYRATKSRYWIYQFTDAEVKSISAALVGSVWFARSHGSMGQATLQLGENGEGTHNYYDGNANASVKEPLKWSLAVYQQTKDSDKYAQLTVSSAELGEGTWLVSPYGSPYATDSAQLVKLTDAAGGADISVIKGDYSETDSPCDI